jgi:tetratricopeptide (TPR) repeat protein
METPAGAPHARQRLIRLLVRPWATGIVAAVLAACAPADPAVTLAQNVRNCENATFPEQQMAACSAAIAAPGIEPTQRAALLIQRGMLHAAQGRHARAVADFGRALRADPANSDALSERGSVHQQRGFFDLALRDYEAALAVDPLNSIAAYRREEAMRGRVDSVAQQLAQLGELIAENAGNSSALNNRCWLLATNDQNLDGALADCNAALVAEPGSAAALDSRGLVYLKREDFPAAIADYEAALAQEPNRGHYLYGRGLARLGLGQNAEGEADLIAAEAAEPGVGQAYAGYGYIPTTPRGEAPPNPAPAKP